LSLAAELFKPLPRWHPRMILHAVAAGVAVVAAMGALAYYLYDNFFYTGFSSAYLRTQPAAESAVQASPGTQTTGAIREEAAAMETARPTEAGSSATIPSVAAPAAKPSALAAERAPRKAALARTAPAPELPRGELCTDAIAAVGLCVPRPGQATAAKAAAGVEAGASAPAATGRAGQRAQPDAPPCTEALRVLGLCTTATIEKKE